MSNPVTALVNDRIEYLEANVEIARAEVDKAAASLASRRFTLAGIEMELSNLHAWLKLEQERWRAYCRDQGLDDTEAMP